MESEASSHVNSALYFTHPAYELQGHFPTPQLQEPEKADEGCQGNTCPHCINTGERASSISGTELKKVFVRTAPKHHSSLTAQGSLREAKPSQRSLGHGHNRLPPGHGHQTEVRSPSCAVQIARETPCLAGAAPWLQDSSAGIDSTHSILFFVP